MRKTLSLIAATGAMLMAGNAAAFDGGERVFVGAFGLGGGQSFTWSYLNVPNNNAIFALTFEIEYGEPVSDISYASDLRVDILTPTGMAYNIGGFDNLQNPWAFDGFGSDAPGIYSDKLFLDAWEPKGFWVFNFANDWLSDPNPNTYAIWVTFQKIPAPGSAALLGLGGLVAMRRRR